MTNPTEGHRAEISAGHALSLERAGIGRYHHARDVRTSRLWSRVEGMFSAERRDGVATGGLPVLFHGVEPDGLDAIKLVAKTYHLNGVGCVFVPLVRLRKMLESHETREHFSTCRVLILQNFQTAQPDPTLTPFARADVEEIVRERLDDLRSVWFHCPTDEVVGDKVALPWWSAEFAAMLHQRSHVVRLSPLVQPGARGRVGTKP
jgi:hypothetical protein